MAANYDSTKIKNVLDFQVGLRPTGAFPLDVRTMFGSLAAAQAAALTAKEAGSTESLYYFGQTLTVFENNEAHQYLIQGDGTLTETGSAVAADDQSIVFEQGVVKLHGWGSEYYAFHEKDNILDPTGCSFPDNMPDPVDNSYLKLADVWYKVVDGAWTPYPEGAPNETDWYEKVTGWKTGLQPKVVSATEGSFELAWFEPSTTTVEGVSAIVSGLQADMEGFNTRLGNLETQFSEMTLPDATLTEKGISRPDGETLTVENGVMSVQAVPMGKVTGLEDKIAQMEQDIADASIEEGKKVFVEQEQVIQAVGTGETPSALPISEKALTDAISWKQTM